MTRNRLTRRFTALTSSLVALATATTLFATPASAAVYLNGAQAQAFAASSEMTHIFSVNPQATAYPGWSSQYVEYRIAVLDATSAGYSWQYYPWLGSYKIAGGGGYNHCDAFGCTWVTLSNVLQSLPSYNIRGAAGHRYQVDIQFGYYNNGWQFTGWTQTEACDTAYQLQGITFKSHGSLCYT